VEKLDSSEIPAKLFPLFQYNYSGKQKSPKASSVHETKLDLVHFDS
jgi:hypothetical protein